MSVPPRNEQEPQGIPGVTVAEFEALPGAIKVEIDVLVEQLREFARIDKAPLNEYTGDVWRLVREIGNALAAAASSGLPSVSSPEAGPVPEPSPEAIEAFQRAPVCPECMKHGILRGVEECDGCSRLGLAAAYLWDFPRSSGEQPQQVEGWVARYPHQAGPFAESPLLAFSEAEPTEVEYNSEPAIHAELPPHLFPEVQPGQKVRAVLRLTEGGKA